MGGLMGGLGGSLGRLVGFTTGRLFSAGKLNETTYVKLELIFCLERKDLF